MSYHYNFGAMPSRIGEFFENMAGGGISAAIFGSIFLGLFTFGLLLVAAYYAFGRLGLYYMTRNAGIPNAWLVFIPFADVYYMGQLTERSLYISTGKRQPVALVYLITKLGLYFVSGASFLAGLWIVGIVTVLGNLFLTVLKFYCLYYIYHDYAPDNEVIFTILGVIPMATAIIFMIIRNTVPVSVAGKKEGGQPKYTVRSRGQQNRQNPQSGASDGADASGYGGSNGPEL